MVVKHMFLIQQRAYSVEVGVLQLLMLSRLTLGYTCMRERFHRESGGKTEV
jgi:hypothetical protein